jgi:hypothetical protein
MSLIGVPVAAEVAPELAAGLPLVLAAGLLAELAAGLVPGLAGVLLPELHPAASAAVAATATTVPIFISLISDEPSLSRAVC